MGQDIGLGTDEHGGTTVRIYLWVWFWLFLITMLEFGVAFVPIHQWGRAALFIIMALMKAALIGGYFMHLRYERINLVYACITPLILGTILFFALTPDALVLTPKP